MATPTPAMIRLASRRDKAETRLKVLREALHRELGFAPRQLLWVPVVGFALGLALARSTGSRRKKPPRSKRV